MSKTLLKASSALACSLLTTSSLATTVVDGYSELSLKYKAKAISTDFNNLTSAEINDNISVFNIDNNQDNSEGDCKDYQFSSLICAEQYGMSFVDDGDSGEALRIEGHDTPFTIAFEDDVFQDRLYGPRAVEFGTLPNYGIGYHEAEQVRLMALFGMIPGVSAEDEETPDQSAPLAPIAESFVTSVDFKVEQDPFGHDSHQMITLGSSKIEIIQPAVGNGSIKFEVPTQSSLGSDRFIPQIEIVNLSTAFPVNSWFNVNIEYNADSGVTTLTLTARNMPEFSPIVHEINNTHPRILSTPLLAAVNVNGLFAVEDPSVDRYESAVTVDNYVSPVSEFDYQMNLSPLTLNGINYIGNENHPHTPFFGEMTLSQTGNSIPSYTIFIDKDNYKLPSDITGAIGNNLNIALISGSEEFNGVTTTYHYTLVAPYEEDELLLVFGEEANITIDAYYENVFIAQGEGLDYKVNSMNVTPEQALLHFINHHSVSFTYLDIEAGLNSRAAKNIINFRDGDDNILGTADDKTFSSASEIDAISYVGPSAMNTLYEFSVTWEAPNVSDPLIEFLNSPSTTLEVLDVDAHLHSDAAANIISHRNGADTIYGTEDDNLFDTRFEIDSVSQVGESTLAALDAYVEQF